MYSPQTGEILGPGTHTLSVIFTSADSVNYTPAEASVSLTVAELIPASVTWPDPPSISYGTVLSAEQLNASSSIPGSFMYAPAAGEVLPAGKHKLSVIFTPKDEEKYGEVQVNVTLIVEELATVASLLTARLQTPPDGAVTRHPFLRSPVPKQQRRQNDEPSQDPQGETRLYKGAVYARGYDGQWHLRRK
jgi:hypothetical protein